MVANDCRTFGEREEDFELLNRAQNNTPASRPQQQLMHSEEEKIKQNKQTHKTKHTRHLHNVEPFFQQIVCCERENLMRVLGHVAQHGHSTHNLISI